ncbi:hypothetical protein J7M02_04230 [Candidatus Aerophobetes bacterium]|nr:hypothetical protein [Candidatus Aerophobetes bacterium]
MVSRKEYWTRRWKLSEIGVWDELTRLLAIGVEMSEPIRQLSKRELRIVGEAIKALAATALLGKRQFEDRTYGAMRILKKGKPDRRRRKKDVL